MKRIEWVRLKLENWARWCALPGGGLGYPRQTSFARFVASDRRDGAVVPLLSLEAEETDRAVRSLQLTRSHLYMVLKLHYCDGLSIHRVAHKMHRAESTVRANLCTADRALAEWYEAIAEQRLKERELVNINKRSFPT
jgi:DNA-directed RNA polymerase specialized sigma24 family protein